jgi:hypothetical protein
MDLVNGRWTHRVAPPVASPLQRDGSEVSFSTTLVQSTSWTEWEPKKKRLSSPILPVTRRFLAEKAERRCVAGKFDRSRSCKAGRTEGIRRLPLGCRFSVFSEKERRHSGRGQALGNRRPFSSSPRSHLGRKTTRISRRRKGRADKNNHTKRLGKKAKRARRQDQRRDCVKCWTDNTG